MNENTSQSLSVSGGLLVGHHGPGAIGFWSEAVRAIQFVVPVQLNFVPKPDITTYELARCMAVVFSVLHGGARYYAESWEAELGDIRRHFEVNAA